MGGQSFKCPFCERWVLAVSSLRGHLKDKHMITNAVIEGAGPATTVVDYAALSQRAIERFPKVLAALEDTESVAPDICTQPPQPSKD